jgi:hypothetical protein
MSDFGIVSLFFSHHHTLLIWKQGIYDGGQASRRPQIFDNRSGSGGPLIFFRIRALPVRERPKLIVRICRGVVVFSFFFLWTRWSTPTSIIAGRGFRAAGMGPLGRQCQKRSNKRDQSSFVDLGFPGSRLSHILE